MNAEWGPLWPHGNGWNEDDGPAWRKTVGFCVFDAQDGESRSVICGACVTGRVRTCLHDGHPRVSSGHYKCDRCGGLLGRPEAHEAAMMANHAWESLWGDA